MSEYERFLLTFDSAQGVPVKAERVGEAGELTEVDLPDFLRSLTPGPAAHAPQQIVINIYGGGAQDPPAVERAAGPPKPPPWINYMPQDHPGGKPPPKPPKKDE
jgi:hypothetical protein